jgi:hypothetical protein
MSAPGALKVIVVGRAPEKMAVARAVLESHGFATTGAFSEDEAQRAIAEHGRLFAVVTGGSIDEAGRHRLRAAAALKGAFLISANIGHDNPKVHFTEDVLPRLTALRDRSGPA